MIVADLVKLVVGLAKDLTSISIDCGDIEFDPATQKIKIGWAKLNLGTDNGMEVAKDG